MRKGKLFIFTGPSGTGKGTLLSRVMAQDERIFLSVSATTRAPRKGEEHGKHYFFLTREDFEQEIEKGHFLEYCQYIDNYYGTLEGPVQQKLEEGCDVVLEIETQGAEQVHKKRPDAVMIFIAPPSEEVLAARLFGRGTETDEVIRKRLEAAQNELTYAETFDYIIVNDDLDTAAGQLAAIFIAERCRVAKETTTI